MAKTKNIKKSFSSLLNKPGFHSTAAIAVDLETDLSDHMWRLVDGYLYISDCSRQISIDLSANNDKEIKNVIYKLDTMIDVLTKARDAFVKVSDKAVKHKAGLPPR